MPKYIIVFPADWFMRVTVRSGMAIATGDQARATRFETADAAKDALRACKGFFKAASVRAAVVREIEG